MRVAQLCHMSLGGSARVATELALALAERGHKVHLIARSMPFGVRAHPAGLQVHTLRPADGKGERPASPTGDLDVNWSGEDLAAFGRLLERVVVSQEIEVLHFHYAMPFALVAADLRQRMGAAAPVIVGTLHGTDVTVYCQHALLGPALAAALLDADQITTVSNDHARLSAEVICAQSPGGDCGGRDALVHVIPNFIDLQRFRPDPAPWAGGPPRRPWRVTHVSNFRPVKDTASVAEIFLRLRRRCPAELWLVGTGSELPATQAALRAGGAGEESVRCWGCLEDVSGVLSQTDLLLMASKGESFCLAALEAMACGVPVVATDVGGLPETVEHGRSGLLYRPRDYDQAERLAVDLLSDRRRYVEMRHEAAARARLFDRDRVVAMYEHLYHRALCLQRRPVSAC
jgi:N-acetyl-alpha-D-glucosaminyl L-malate synthase BshA